MGLKELGKDVVARTAKSSIVWPVYRLCGRLSTSLGRIYGHAHFTREIGERDETLRKLARELFPELIVADGPFRGVRYPSAQSYGSALLPKLLGSYESELHSALERLLSNRYTAVVDIGCAEGYYAVGLGLRCPQAEVYAFDISSDARRICGEVAKLNGLDSRFHVGAFCDQAALKSIPLGTKGLIISDCEGYEGTLFSEDMAQYLAKHDLIIETHDFIDIEISSMLRDVFAKTHQVVSIKSVDDIEKAHTYRYALLERYDMKTRRLILAERRPAIMEWLVLTSKHGQETN
jgi:precorrin-6B methylase 2